MGPILGAEFLVAVGDIRTFESADKLAAYAGLVPAARDSSKRVGNNKRMRGGNKVLKRVFYQSAFASLRSAPSPGPSTIARGLRARGTPRLSSLWRVGGSTSCGSCCVTGPRLRTALRLDIFIEILLRIPVNRANTKDRDFSAPSLFMRVDNAPSCCLPPRGWRGSGECPGVVGHHVARFVLDSSEADLSWRAHLLMAASPRPRRAVYRAVVAAKDVAAHDSFSRTPARVRGLILAVMA
jgi:Transposase IS116/IS110/IS902 family